MLLIYCKILAISFFILLIDFLFIKYSPPAHKTPFIYQVITIITGILSLIVIFVSIIGIIILI